VTFTTSLSESCFSDVTTVSSDKSDDRCSETNDFGDDVYIAVGISNTEKASLSDISDEGDERLSLSHAVDKKEISTDILLEGDGERGGKSTKLSILMGLLLCIRDTHCNVYIITKIIGF
jgi:hypothetical protein